MWKNVIEYKSCQKRILWIFPHGFIVKLELAKVQTGKMFDRFFVGDKLVSEYFQGNF